MRALLLVSFSSAVWIIEQRTFRIRVHAWRALPVYFALRTCVGLIIALSFVLVKMLSK